MTSVDSLVALQSLVNRGQRLWRRVLSATWYRAIMDSVGERTIFYPFQLLINPKFIRVGSRSLIRNGARFEIVLHGQDWVPSLTIGDNVNIEQNVHIVCHDRVTIGNDVSITGNCAIVDVTHPYSALRTGGKIGDAIDPARSFVEIGDGSFIGFGSIILPNVRVGRGCMIGAGSVVVDDIPDFSVAFGVPARIRTRPTEGHET